MRGAAKRARGGQAGLACIVLAAGKGTRMRSSRGKVLHRLLGRELVVYPVACARQLGASPVIVVVGHQGEAVEAALARTLGEGAVAVVEQTEQKGTGHALRMALPALDGWDGIAVVLYGDVPLLREETVRALVEAAGRTGSLAVVTARPPDPAGYGRVIRDRRGSVLRVVEDRDATPSQRKVREINAGIYAAPVEFLRQATAAIEPHNAQGEYYLTDVVERAAASVGVQTVEANMVDVAGINDRQQLAQAEAVLRERINRRWMDHVTFRDPATTIVEPEVWLDVDVELGRNVALRGRTRIHEGATIDDGVVLVDTEVGAGAEVRPYCVATGAVIGPRAKVGPFAHLRPGTDLAADVHVGNFVETKKARLGRGSKANHLSYLGDADIGEDVNVGAGTITCNYNGYEKSVTVIEDGAFIGSDTQLVAPVTVRRRAIVAAGTTVTEEVPAGALAIARVSQKNVPGYADRVARRYAERGAPSRRDSSNRE